MERRDRSTGTRLNATSLPAVSISRYLYGMARLRESYDPGEVKNLLESSGPASSDDVSVTADGRRLDTAAAVVAFFDEMRASRSARPSSD